MSDPAGLAVSIEGISKRFGRVQALDAVSLGIGNREMMAILGPNGAGKSTLILILCTLLEADSGRASVAGIDVRSRPREARRRLGVVFQESTLDTRLTVEENLDFYAGIYSVPQHLRSERKQEVLRMAGLEEKRTLITRLLAGGWKQRLALGCAILHKPPIVFLDEPTSGVDPIARRTFWDLIYQLSASGHTVFVSTHYMDEAEYCHRVSIMVDGKIEALDSPKGLKKTFNASSMDEVFLKLARKATRTAD